ncbi:hypothetical protein MRB53_038262 [Persea americana]|nr:hypothetical protein MRB53_038262 [Persea americana]
MRTLFLSSKRSTNNSARNADAPYSFVPSSKEPTHFILPLEEPSTLSELFEFLTTKQSCRAPVRYAQSQNDNLRNEYAALLSDVSNSPDFARIALQREPDAINLWIGNDKSVTSMHRDNYENVYVQVLGQKHFVLIPPLMTPGIREKQLRCAHYRRKAGSASAAGELNIEEEQPERLIPWPIWDPDSPEEHANAYSPLIKPTRVTLSHGDMLYLPALWYHKVSQSCDRVEDVCVAVNYWSVQYGYPPAILDVAPPLSTSSSASSYNRRACHEFIRSRVFGRDSLPTRRSYHLDLHEMRTQLAGRFGEQNLELAMQEVFDLLADEKISFDHGAAATSLESWNLEREHHHVRLTHGRRMEADRTAASVARLEVSLIRTEDKDKSSGRQ